ncbi:eukaryotic aspartyl protease domain-containing protein [Ditylenchus destructor]|nr:eukaryotic aspartyl protease domain-containing protein [Ditylenchus destructor]
MRKSHNRQMRNGIEEELDGGPNMRCMAAGKVPVEQLTRDLFAGNISIGSPRQEPFYVYIDLFWGSELAVIDSRADLSDIRKYFPPKKTFNSSASITYEQQTDSFAYLYDMVAHFGSDYVMFGEAAANLTFVIYDHVPDFALELPVDGMLGLSSKDRRYNISFFEQIMPELDQPIISFWTNRIHGFQNGTAEITIGAEDTDHCEPNWTYSPEISLEGTDWWYSTGYAAHVTGFTAELDGQELMFRMNKSLIFFDGYGMAAMPHYLKYFFINAADAVWNQTMYQHIVDCDIDRHANVTLHINGSHDIVMYPSDYVAYMRYWNVCFLDIWGYDDDEYNFMTLPINFWNGHCFAYNHATREVGLADAKRMK